MKLFLKPTAIFACIALLFCAACADDETEDLSYTLAPVTLAAPVDMTAASGNGRAALTWRVPDDSGITHAMIQWDNADEAAGLSSNLNEITRYAVVPGSKATYYIGEVGDLESRNHNFKITHIKVNSNSTITDRSETVEINSFYIYGNATYSDSMPNPYSVSTSGTSTANISWSRFDEDLYSVKLSYTSTESGTIDKTDDFFINEDNPTITLDDAVMDTVFKFYAYFLPENGLDIVEIASTTDLDMASSAASPTSVAVAPGLGRMRVRWMIPSNESIVSTIVQYKRVADNSGYSVSGTAVKIQYGGDEIKDGSIDYYYDEDVLINNRNERYISGATDDPSGNSDDESGGLWASIRPLTFLTSGYYEVSVINRKENGKYSTAVEEDGTLQTIHVYGYDSFTHATLSGVPLRDATGVVKFDFIENLTWNNATSVCTGVTLYYTDGNGDAQSQTGTLDYFSETGLSDTKVATTFTYETNFSPGLDDLVLPSEGTSDNTFIPDVAPNSPSSVTAQSGVYEVSDSGNFENQTPVIYVTWTPDEDAEVVNEDGSITYNISYYRIYWYAVSGTVYKTDYLSVEDLTKNEDGAYTYTISENLESDTKYYIEVISASEELEGIDGRTESEKIEVFDRPVTYSYATYKDAPLEWGALKNNGYTTSIVWSSIPSDCIGVAIYYNKANTPNTRYPDSGYLEVSSVLATTALSSAIVGEPFTYVVYHQPTSGADPVKVWCAESEANVIPEPVPVPSIMSLTPSFTSTTDDSDVTTYSSSIFVQWEGLVDSDKVVDKMYLRYGPTGGETTDIRVSTSTSSTTLTLTTDSHGLVAGTLYEFQMVTEDSDEQDFQGNNLTSESEVMSARAYDATSYSAADLPIATAYTDGSIAITWSNISDDLEYITLSYAEEDKTGYLNAEKYTRAQLEDGFSITYNGSYLTFTYDAVFCPSGGTTSIDVTGGVGVVLMPPASSSDYEIAGSGDSDGYASGTWKIYTGAGLKAFATQVNSNSSSRSLNAVLMNDIDMSAVCGYGPGSWTPIGTSGAAYTGSFDGNGKTIYRLYIDTESQYQGLFGYLNSATVSNVKLANVSVTTSNASACKYFGALAGYVTGGTVSECEISSGTVESTGINAAYIGAFAGYFGGGATISDCVNYASVTSATQQVGGIIGGHSAGFSATIERCINYGTITNSSGSYAGGIVSYAYTNASGITLTDCVNYGAIIAPGYAGGIAAIVRSNSAGVVTFSRCVNETTGVVTSTAANAGGIAGFINPSHASGYIYITNCVNKASVTASGKNNVGGILGNDSNNTGGFKMAGCINSGAVTGASNVGGLAGILLSGHTIGDSKVSTLYYNEGDVTGTAEASVGALVGANYGAIYYYYNTSDGDVSPTQQLVGTGGTGTMTDCEDRNANANID